MTIQEIKEMEASIEMKAAAVSQLLPAIQRQAFDCTMEGVLGKGSYWEQSAAAYKWVYDNYPVVAAAVYSAGVLCDEIYEGLDTIYSELMRFQGVSRPLPQ